MLFKQLALAASAVAFVIVPDISEADEGIFRALPIESSGEPLEYPPSALAQTVELPCLQCHGNVHLKMDFAVQDGQALVLNGFELYPNADPWHGDLTANVVKANGKEKEDRLGYSLAVRPEAMDVDQQFELVGVELRVIEVGSRFVEGVPPVKVQLIKAPGGDIIIGSIDVEAMGEQPEDKCTTIWCHIQGLLDDTWKEVKGFKGCGGKNAQGQEAQDDRIALHGSESQEGYEFNHGKVGHGKDHSSHPYAQVMKNFTSYIIIPILMGITAGVGVAILSMFISAIIIRLVLIFKGNRPEETPLGCSHKVADAESQADEEKAGLMTEQEAPPQYEPENRN